MRRAGVVLALGVMVLSPADGAGQDPSAEADSLLRLGAAVRHAMETYPALGAAVAQVERAEGASREAKADRLPSVRLSGSAVRYEEPMIVRPLHGFDPQSAPPFDETLVQGEATAAYTLFDGGARSARIRRADAERGVASAELARTRAAVVARVARGYLEVLNGAEVLQAHNQQLEALRAEGSRVRSLLEEGAAPEIQLLRVQAALEAADADAVAARWALETAELELSRLTGLPPARTTREQLAAVELVPGGVPDREAATARAHAANPEVAAAERALAAAEAGVELAGSARWPDLDAFGTYWERGGGETQFQGEWAAGVKVSFPLFTGGAVTGRIDQAQAGARAARERLRQARLDVSRQVDGALARVEETGARVEALARAAERQEAVVRTERVALEIGSGTQAEYLRAEADLLTVRAALSEARNARMTAHLELARQLGTLDEEWIESYLETR